MLLGFSPQYRALATGRSDDPLAYFAGTSLYRYHRADVAGLMRGVLV